MSIELDEVVVQDISDANLELAAAGAKEGFNVFLHSYGFPSQC